MKAIARLANVQSELAQQDFLNGKIDAGKLTDQEHSDESSGVLRADTFELNKHYCSLKCSKNQLLNRSLIAAWRILHISGYLIVSVVDHCCTPWCICGNH